MTEMKKRYLLPAALFSFFLLACPQPCFSLELSKGLPHYAREMEFYYMNERPEILTPLFRNFHANGVMARAENRLMLAAFFAELARKKKLNLESFVRQNQSLGKDARHTLAWTAHLAGSSNERKLLGELLEPQEKPLLTQIKNTSASLLDWPLNREKSVLQMYWAAYMASGNPSWLDAIIESALKLARSQNSPRNMIDPGGTESAAAASLYDLVPTHKSVRERVMARRDGKSGNEKKILDMILHEDR